MSSLTPKTYVMGLTAEEIEKRLLAVDSLLSKDVIRQSLSNPSAATVPSTQAVVDALSPINSTLNTLGDLSIKDSVSLDSNETSGVLPLNKGGTGGSTLQDAQHNLGILTQTEIQDLITNSIPTIQQVWLDSNQVLGVLPVTKGGTGSNSPAQALKNLGIHDSNGKVPVAQLPAVAITDTFPVSSEAAMLSLTAEKGDVAIRTDINKSFILMQEPANILANWKELLNDAEVKLTPRIRESLRRSYAEAGYNLVAGSFEIGGTLVNTNDVLLQDSTGKAYSGPAGVVAPGTNPTSGGFVDLSGSVFAVATIDTLGSGVYGVGANVALIDRAYAKFKVVSGGVPDGHIVLSAGNGNTAVYVNSGIINVEHFGAVADCWLDAAHTQPNPTPTDNTVAFSKALSLKGTLEIPFRPNGYMYSARLLFSDRVVHGNGATLVPHNFSDEYSATFHNVKINDLKFKPRDWGLNSFDGRPYLVTFTSILDRCDFTAYQKSQLFFDDINASPKVQPYYTEHRECRFRYFKEHNIVVKQGANLIKFFGGITGWAGSPAYMQPPTVEGLYDGLVTTRDSSPAPIGPYTPESLVILGMDSSYNSRYGFNFNKLSFADVSTGYTEYNLKKAMRLGDIVGSSILANKISDGYVNEIPLIDWNNAEGVGRYHNRIVVNGQSIGSGASTGTGLKALNFELAYSQSILTKQGCYPILTGTPAGYVQLTSIFPQTYAEFQLDDNFNLKSNRKGHDIQTRVHEFSSALPAPTGYDKTFAWLRSTGELFFCNPVSGWKKVTLV